MSLPNATNSSARFRVPRLAEVAVERARLSLVPQRAHVAPRAPFITLVLLLLGFGVAGLLLFNTSIQQGAFAATDLRVQATELKNEKQQLQLDLAELKAPQSLATRAHELGMVRSTQAAFMTLPNGKVVGDPISATKQDRMRIVPLPAAKPKDLLPEPLVRFVSPRPASTDSTPPTGTTETPSTTAGSGATP